MTSQAERVLTDRKITRMLRCVPHDVEYREIQDAVQDRSGFRGQSESRRRQLTPIDQHRYLTVPQLGFIVQVCILLQVPARLPRLFIRREARRLPE